MFLPTLASPLPSSEVVLKMAPCIPSVEPWSLVPEMAEQTLQIIVWICSNPPGDYLKDWHKVLVFVSLKSEFIQGRKVMSIAQKYCKANRILQLPGAKIIVKLYRQYTT